jgi:hypothetical protein
MRKTAFLTIILSLPMTATTTLSANGEKALNVSIENKWDHARTNEPVTLKLKNLNLKFDVQSALVSIDGKEVTSQLDDLDGDGDKDELAFITDLKPAEKKTFSVRLSSEKSLLTYPPQVYAEMLVLDSKKNRIPIQSMTVLNDGNPYTSLHHHGPAFESDLIGLRIYFDQRQTVDAYGKRRKGLEIKDTQFYPTAEQKAEGYGDDVLWVGNTLGAGTLRGWNGTSPTLLSPVAKRTEAIRAYGPIRTVVEVTDEGWNCNGNILDMTTRYILYAGHRDCEVNVRFGRALEDERFCVGITNVKGSESLSDHKGLVGCWGTDWPVDVKDSAGHKQETVGLAVYIPNKYVKSEPSPTNENYLYVVGRGGTKTDRIKYYLAFCSADESFGFKNKDEWFSFLRQWREGQQNDCIITIKE